MTKIILELLLIYCGICASEKPHIILIIGDDMGWNDVGFHGSNQIPTPNIDALGYNGVILNKFYTQATCTPSRAALLTGQYPMRIGYQGYPLKAAQNRHIPLNVKTTAEQLKSLDYSTYLIGKWHLGHACKKYCPSSRGFDQHFGYWNGYVSYFNYTISQNIMTGYDLHDNFDAVVPENKYATDIFTSNAVEIIENHNKTKPLFLMVSHLAPHTGYNGSALEVPDLNHTDEKFYYIKDVKRRRYADLVNRLDDSVGKIVKSLSDEDMLKNSIIVFISDNGGQTIGIHENSASNWPLKGLKFTLFEGSVRVPAVIYSPLLINKGYINNELIHISDLYSTFYSRAGGDLRNLSDLDSVDQWKTISEKQASKRQEILLDIDEVRNTRAIIGNGGKYKLINGIFEDGIYDNHFGDSGRNEEVPNYNITDIINSHVNKAISKIDKAAILTEDMVQNLRTQTNINCNIVNPSNEIMCPDGCLFDLIKDPCEYSNIISNFPNIANDLNDRIVAYEKELVPQANFDVDYRGDPKYFNGTWSNWLEGIEC